MFLQFLIKTVKISSPKHLLISFFNLRNSNLCEKHSQWLYCLGLIIVTWESTPTLKFPVRVRKNPSQLTSQSSSVVFKIFVQRLIIKENQDLPVMQKICVFINTHTCCYACSQHELNKLTCNPHYQRDLVGFCWYLLTVYL